MSKTNGSVNRGPFASQEEANQHKPTTGKYQLFKVTDPTGKVSFCWANVHGGAIQLAARAAGWKVASAGKVADKSKVADMLAGLSAEDRAALLAQYQPAKGKK